jgi:NADH-quinone oxidoreductase subunit N
MDVATKLSLTICTAGICLLGVASCVYEWIAAAAL